MPPAANHHELAGRVALTTTRLSRLLRQQDQGELPLTSRAALATVERHGPLTLGELADIEHLAPPSVTKVTGKLEERGLIKRQADPADRRVTRVAITPAGARLLATDRKRRTAWLEGRLSRLPDDERARLEAAIAVLESLTEREVTGQAVAS